MRELLTTVGELKEGLNKLVKRNQCNHCQETPYGDAHPMEEFYIVQSAYGLSGKRE